MLRRRFNLNCEEMSSKEENTGLVSVPIFEDCGPGQDDRPFSSDGAAPRVQFLFLPRRYDGRRLLGNVSEQHIHIPERQGLSFNSS